jgi:hypothetical protein
MSDETRQSIVDEEHLKLLSLGYVVSGGVSAFFSLFGLLYVFMGIIMGAAISHMPETASRPNPVPPPAFVVWLFAGFGLAIFLLAMGMAAARFRTAWCIKHRTWRTFCMVIAAIGCLEIPYGTALGVFSFIVLGRDSVVRLFNPAPPAGAPTQR